MEIGEGMEPGFTFVPTKPTSTEAWEQRRKAFEAEGANGKVVNPLLAHSQEVEVEEFLHGAGSDSSEL
ncbi:MAG: hypothetical protein AAB436_04545 [Patescibacteria group bacterium]